jgi:hypothetical protein
MRGCDRSWGRMWILGKEENASSQLGGMRRAREEQNDGVRIVVDEAALLSRATCPQVPSPDPPMMSARRSDFLEPAKFPKRITVTRQNQHTAPIVVYAHRHHEVERQEHPIPDAGRLASPDCGMRPHHVFPLRSGGLTLMKTMTDRNG